VFGVAVKVSAALRQVDVDEGEPVMERLQGEADKVEGDAEGAEVRI
jgi:hypothetical protein